MCGGVVRHKSRLRTLSEMSDVPSGNRVWPMSRAVMLGIYERTGKIYFPIPTDLAVPTADLQRISRNVTGADYRYHFNDTGTGACSAQTPERASYLASTGVVSRCGHDYKLPGISDTVECRVIPYPFPPLTDNAFTEMLGTTVINCKPVANMLMSWAGDEADWKPPTSGITKCTSFQSGFNTFRPDGCTVYGKNGVDDFYSYPLYLGTGTIMKFPYAANVPSPNSPGEGFNDYGDTKYDIGHWRSEDENQMVSDFLQPMAIFTADSLRSHPGSASPTRNCES
jgi:hypothetical protein